MSNLHGIFLCLRVILGDYTLDYMIFTLFLLLRFSFASFRNDCRFQNHKPKPESRS